MSPLITPEGMAAVRRLIESVDYHASERAALLDDNRRLYSALVEETVRANTLDGERCAWKFFAVAFGLTLLFVLPVVWRAL